MNIVEFKINGKVVDLNIDDIDYRLNRFASDPNKIVSNGGDFSTNFIVPFTKRNNVLFNINSNISQIGKFNRYTSFLGELLINGVSQFKGLVRLNSINASGYELTLTSESIDWIDLLSEFNLTELGYRLQANSSTVKEPTWLIPFEGGTTINQLNAISPLSINKPDIFFPTIVYNNTPITDYIDFTQSQLFGKVVSGNQTSEPIEFPESFTLKNAYFSQRQGLTFEDFPPAVYYDVIIKKCFEQIGWNVNGDIFNTDWFKRLYVPFTKSSFYKYNWKTLAYLFANPTYRQLPLDLFTTNAQLCDIIIRDVFLTNTLGGYNYTSFAQNIPFTDQVSNRIDKVANFKQAFITDTEKQIPERSRANYICPASGQYKIKVKSKVRKHLNVSFPNAFLFDFNDLDYVGSGNPGFGWDDNILVVTRQNQTGSYVLNTDPLVVATQMFENTNEAFTFPSDIIAYVSPKKCGALGVTNVRAAGSPLSNFENTVNVASFNHSIITNSSLDKISESSCEFDITIDLLQNERVGFYWVSLVQLQNFVTLKYTTEYVGIDTNNITSTDNLIEIEYICGSEDLNIATNLPEINCKDFVADFIRMFNLKFSVNPDSKTVTFVNKLKYFTDSRLAISIDKFVDTKSNNNNNNYQHSFRNMYPLKQPKNLIIGYDNDVKDRLLLDAKLLCEADITTVSNYANIEELNNPNAYSKGTLKNQNGFSATKFVNGTIILTDIADPSFNPQKILIFNNVGGYNFVKGFEYNATNFYITPQLPSIQSQTSFLQNNVSQLEYDYDYKLRILSNFGSAYDYYQNNPSIQPSLTQTHRIKINNPDFSRLSDPAFWIIPTISSFDNENLYNGSIPGSNSHRTLRYDTSNGIYINFFENYFAKCNNTHLIDLDIRLTLMLWNKLQANQLISFNNDVYELVKIEDYDPINPANLARITIQKLI